MTTATQPWPTDDRLLSLYDSETTDYVGLASTEQIEASRSAGVEGHIRIDEDGNVVESGPIRELFHRPSHGYTLGLMGSTPRVDGKGVRRLTPIEGMPPSLIEPIRLCPFLPRCRVAVAACQTVPPERRDFGRDHWARCLADLAP